MLARARARSLIGASAAHAASVCSSISHHERIRIGHTDVFAGQDQRAGNLRHPVNHPAISRRRIAKLVEPAQNIRRMDFAGTNRLLIQQPGNDVHQPRRHFQGLT